MARISGLREIFAAYDGFVIDQWGVLHDGVAAYPGAVECLRALEQMGKPVVMLSNSGKRAVDNARRIAEFGFAPDRMAAIITSGEVAWQALAQQPQGLRCFVITRGQDRSIIAGSPVVAVAEIAQAELLLVGGIDTPARALSSYQDTLEQAVSRGLPMLCANPDIIAVDGGELIDGPGQLARRYEALGGRVRWIGKPHPEIYQYVRASLGAVPPARILAIGDSLEHDICGGVAAGFGSLLITGGIHANRFAQDQDFAQDSGALENLAREFGAFPDHWMSRLVW